MHPFSRRDGRVAEGAPLLREYRLNPYRGFESLSLRHILINSPAKTIEFRSQVSSLSSAFSRREYDGPYSLVVLLP